MRDQSLLKTPKSSILQKLSKNSDTKELNAKSAKIIIGGTQSQKQLVVIPIVMENIHSLGMVSEKEKKLLLLKHGKDMSKVSQQLVFHANQLKDIQSWQDGETM